MQQVYLAVLWNEYTKAHRMVQGDAYCDDGVAANCVSPSAQGSLIRRLKWEC